MSVSRNRRYLMTDKVNGEPRGLHDKIVDREFVDNYTALSTRAFFINLGGVEEMRRTKSGTIICKSISPDGGTVREARFMPLPDSPTEQTGEVQ